MVVNLAVIPARGGSKGIPRKNLCMLAGKPLICWTIECALSATSISQVVVSTDDEDIKEIAKQYGVVDIRDRPANLAKDDVHAVHVVVDCLKYYQKKGIIVNKVAMLLPTSPMRSARDVDNALALFNYYDCDSVIGVRQCDKPESNFRYINTNGILEPIKEVEKFEVQRQDIIKPVYEVSGAMFASSPEHILKHKSFHVGRPVAYIMDKISSMDINDVDDFRMVEALLCYL